MIGKILESFRNQKSLLKKFHRYVPKSGTLIQLGIAS